MKQNETRTYVVSSYPLICTRQTQSLGHGNAWSLGTILLTCLPRACSYRELAGGHGRVYRGRGNPSFSEYHKCWHVWNTLYDRVLCKIWQDQDDVVMISSGSEPGSPQKKERASIVLLLATIFTYLETSHSKVYMRSTCSTILVGTQPHFNFCTVSLRGVCTLN